jgi:hypothetical protein
MGLASWLLRRPARAERLEDSEATLLQYEDAAVLHFERLRWYTGFLHLSAKLVHSVVDIGSNVLLWASEAVASAL